MKKRATSFFVICLMLVLLPILVACGGNANALSANNLKGAWRIQGTTTAVTINVLANQDGVLSGTFSGGLTGAWSVEDDNMTTSIDGIRAVFSPNASSNPNPTTAQLDVTVTRLQQMLDARGYVGATVTRQELRDIKIEMLGTDTATSFFDAIGTPVQLSMNMVGADDHEVIHFTNDDIQSVGYTQQTPTQHGTVLNFTTAGGDKFLQLINTVGIDKTIEIWAGDRNNPHNLISSPVVTEISPNMKESITIPSATRDIAQELRTRIEGGLLEVILQPDEIYLISITLDSGVLSNKGRTLSLSGPTTSITLVRPA